MPDRSKRSRGGTLLDVRLDSSAYDEAVRALSESARSHRSGRSASQSSFSVAPDSRAYHEAVGSLSESARSHRSGRSGSQPSFGAGLDSGAYGEAGGSLPESERNHRSGRSASQSSFSVGLDSTEYDRAISGMSENAEKFGRSFSTAIRSAIASGKGFDDTLKSVSLRLSKLALEQAFEPLEQGFSRLVSGLSGGALGSPQATAGQANPSGRAASIPNVIFNVAAQDASSFARSQSQIGALLARAVIRGGRFL